MASVLCSKQSGAAGCSILLSGKWSASEAQHGADEALRSIADLPQGTKLLVDGTKLENWDSSFLAWLFKLDKACRARGLAATYQEIPEGASKLLALAFAVPERKGARRSASKVGFFERLGRGSVTNWKELGQSFAFLGELTLAAGRALVGRAKVPRSDVWRIVAECGPASLPIVTLISGLVGLILAFLGAQQLRQFGAVLYTANLVGVALTREMGAVMAGVIMAGRVGAAFAAQLGTMQVNEEIDALKTFGFSPMEYLVLPRIFALVLMMPLLCLYADFVGIAGGALVSWVALDITPAQFYSQLKLGVKPGDIWFGVVKSAAFGALIGLCGCMKGITCGRSASSVGLAVTSAVVLGIVSIVIADALFALLGEVLGP